MSSSINFQTPDLRLHNKNVLIMYVYIKLHIASIPNEIYTLFKNSFSTEILVSIWSRCHHLAVFTSISIRPFKPPDWLLHRN